MRANITPLGGGEPEPWILEQLAHSRGANDGMRRGLEEGRRDGYDQGYRQGYMEGNTAGYNEAIDEANGAIAKIQAQNTAYLDQATANYQALEVERDQLKQELAKQANYILLLEEQLAQHDQVALQQQAKFDTQLAAYQLLKQENEILQKDIAALTQQTNLVQGKNASLDETIKDLAKTNHEKHSKIQEQSAHYNRTLTFLNAILGAVKSTLEINPAIENSFRKLFIDEYKKSVDFRILVDDIKAAPHKDSDFALLLPQTNEFIRTMLENECHNELLKNNTRLANELHPSFLSHKIEEPFPETSVD